MVCEYVRKNGETYELGVLILVLMEYGLREAGYYVQHFLLNASQSLF